MHEGVEGTERILFTVEETLVPGDPRDYLDRIVEVPRGTTALRVELDFVKVTDRFQLYAALLDTDGRLRGHVQCPGGPGPRAQRFVVGEREASPGAVAGPIEPGEWTLRLDLDRFREAGEYALRLIAHDGEATTAGGAPSAVAEEAAAADPVAEEPEEATAEPAAERWLLGELHSHSEHSDGRASVADILAAARTAGLDFYALSDHFTWSHWRELDALRRPDDPLTLHSIEVTTHLGHANVHGLREWVDVYVDRPGRDCGELAREVHAQGGLFCVNHPFSGQQAWRRSDVPWREFDLIEVVNQGQDANNDAAIGLWDRLLAEGNDIAPVAGTDCHDPHDEAQRLGQVMTGVRVAGDDAAAVLAGLASAATIVTRGSAIDLTVSSSSATAGLGERIRIADLLRVTVRVDARVAGTVFVMRDGLMWHQEDVPAGRSTLELVDAAPVAGAYRAELHRSSDDPRHWASAWRSHESFEALTSYVRVVSDAQGGSALPRNKEST